VLCDIDGTVALHTTDPDRWESVNLRSHYGYEPNAVLDDTPNGPVIAVVRGLMLTYTVIFVSGREETCRQQTIRWLINHSMWTPPWALLMRKAGDYRPDYEIKLELFNEHIRGKYNVLLAIDDRNQVVRLWRDLSLTCIQVADGDF
jgi:hypothetical protein